VVKNVFSTHKKDTNKTDEGPQPKPISLAVAGVIELCKDRAFFKNLDGVDAFVDLIDKKH
jgi:hypothetical protein